MSLDTLSFSIERMELSRIDEIVRGESVIE
jgi:hypothetical protein